LIGATTENPSFAINAALLSRARVFRIEPLTAEHLVTLLERALTDRDRGLGGPAVRREHIRRFQGGNGKNSVVGIGRM
jgi:putative ATPase